MDDYEATLVDVSSITPTVKHFLFELDGDWSFSPGQHTVFTLDIDGEDVHRPYTMTNLSRDKNRFSVAVKRYDDGTGSVHMHGLDRGDTVSVSEPKGNLHLQNYTRDVVFLSTGTGATPMIAMLREYLERGSGTAYYLHGEKTTESRLFTSELTLLDAEQDDLSVVYSLSDESWQGREGFIQDHVDDVVDVVNEPDYYVCGVPQMVVAAREKLLRLGVSDDQIISEGWEEDAA